MRQPTDLTKTTLNGCKRGRSISLLAVPMMAWAVATLEAQDQANSLTSLPAEKHTSGLGINFVPVRGTPVLISTLETRVNDFEQFVSDTGYSWDHKPHFPQTKDHPVVNVSLKDAIAYCNWLTDRDRKAGKINNLQSYRLPTSEEWSAAVGLTAVRKDRQTVSQEVEDKRAFPWGVEWPPPVQAGNYNSKEINNTDDGYVYTSPVGIFSPSADGIFDMGGNVWEWTWNQEERPDAFGTLRGGSWMYFRKECLLSGYEYQVPGELRAPSVGFRCIYEDKHRTAVYLAAAEKDEEKADLEKRGMLETGPKVTSEEVEKMRQSMMRKSSPDAKPTTRPDIKTLAPAKAGAPYLNSLGMTMRPVGDGGALLVAEHEVTVQNYKESLAGGSKTWAAPTFQWKENHPVMNVSWQDARDFCEWLTAKERAANIIGANASYRLPTDAEWSLAANLLREEGSTPAEKHEANKSDYPWGIEWPPPSLSANLDTARMTSYQDNFSHTAPVGTFSPNGNRLYDLSGNVAEWCEDPWPGTTGERVVRGGSWLSSTKESLLSSSRQHLSETSTRGEVGFRVVLALEAK